MNNYLYRCIVSGSCTPTDTSATARLTVTQIPITTTIQGISNSCTGNLNIPINVINCNNVGGISLTITFDTTLLGSYSIDAKLSKAYVKLSGFTFGDSTSITYTNSSFKAIDLNRAWTIVILENDVMYLSATDNAGAIRSLEYVKN